MLAGLLLIGMCLAPRASELGPSAPSTRALLRASSSASSASSAGDRTAARAPLNAWSSASSSASPRAPSSSSSSVSFASSAKDGSAARAPVSAWSGASSSASSSASASASTRATRLAATDGEPTHVVIVADAPGKLVEDARLALSAGGRAVEVRILVGDGMRDFANANASASGDRTVFLAAGKKSAFALARSSIAAKAAFLVKREDAPEGIASVVLEPSPEEQLAWARIAFPGRTRVIVPRSPAGAQAREDDRWRAAATKTGLTLALVDVRSAGEAVPALKAALKGAPSIIVFVADAVAVTADTVAPLVQSALASRTPAIGFSTYFLKVGALGAISVDAGAMASQALALAMDASGAPSSRTVSPERARLIVDGKLAERLGVVTRDGPGVEVRR